MHDKKGIDNDRNFCKVGHNIKCQGYRHVAIICPSPLRFPSLNPWSLIRNSLSTRLKKKFIMMIVSNITSTASCAHHCLNCLLLGAYCLNLRREITKNFTFTFHMFTKINGKSCQVIVDNDSYNNVVPL